MGPVDVTDSIVYSDNTDAGTATRQASWDGDANHTGNTGSSTFDIGQASSTVTVDCTTGAPFTYTGSANEPCTAQATGAGMSPVDVTDSIVYSDNTDAGTAGAQASWDGDANHTGNTGIEHVRHRPGQLDGDRRLHHRAPFTYTGSAIEPCTAQATGAGMSPVDVTDSIVYSDNTDAGTAGAQASWDGDANHTGNTGSSTFDIGQAELTITADAIPSTVAVDHFSRPFGYANPPFIVRYLGFVNGETPSVLGGTLTFSTAATSQQSDGVVLGHSGRPDIDQLHDPVRGGTLDITAGYRIVGFTSPVDMTTVGGRPTGTRSRVARRSRLSSRPIEITPVGTLGAEITIDGPAKCRREDDVDMQCWHR